MKQFMFYRIFLWFALAALFSCSTGKKESGTQETTNIDTVKTEADLLLNYLVEKGDYVNSRQFPSMLKPSTLFENLKKNILVVDIRDAGRFSLGHISGAVRVDFSQLPDFFQNKIKPFQYEKIVLVSEYGQQSSYATCLLRLMGYGNVYSMRWGMAAWNHALAKENNWEKICSDRYAKTLDTITYFRSSEKSFPKLQTGKKTGEEIFKDRIGILFSENLNEILLPADDVFSKRDSLYIINYDRKDKYEAGHIPGAIRYKPNGLLGIASEMKSIPVDKPIVIYCETGHNSAFVAAYLRLFGYNAHTLKYGGNSFMYGLMKNDHALSWNMFTPDQQNDYPITR